MKKIGLFITAALTSLALTLPAMAETLTIVGTGDGITVLKSIGAAFTKNHPDVTVDVPKSIGSGGAIKAVGSDENTLGRVARGLKDKEKPLGLTYIPYAKIPVVFVVNPSSGVDALTAAQVNDIYSGTITDWQEVGGKAGKIRVVRREDGDSSLEVLQNSFPGFKDITITDKAKTALKTPEMIELVAKKEGTIGFGPYDVAKANNLHAISIDGMAPTDAGYPAVGTMALIFKEANNTGATKEFIDFATSGAASEAVTAAGGMMP